MSPMQLLRTAESVRLVSTPSASYLRVSGSPVNFLPAAEEEEVLVVGTAAAAGAIAALSRFAAAHARTISEIDINPLLLMPEGQGVVALDALLVPHSEGKGKES